MGKLEVSENYQLLLALYQQGREEMRHSLADNYVGKRQAKLAISQLANREIAE